MLDRFGPPTAAIDRPHAELSVRSMSFAVAWRPLLTAAVLATLLAAALSHRPAAERQSAASRAHAALSPRAGLSSLPLAAQGPISAALGAQSPAYRAIRTGNQLQTTSPAQQLSARYARGGVMLSTGTLRLGFSLHAVGDNSAPRRIGHAEPSAHGNRVSYAHDRLTEWYVNGPAGLEQGFTVARAESTGTAGQLLLSLTRSGNARATPAADGRSIRFSHPGARSLSYGGLNASDARGRTLPSTLELRAGALLLRVDTRGARYPLRIDPLIQLDQKLTPPDGGTGLFGFSVALSSDAGTALIGAPRVGGWGGVAWVFARSGATWTQQGPKLTGSAQPIGEPEACVEEAGEEAGECGFGGSVALSADGNTALVGGSRDNGYIGAAWVFTRSGEEWTQPGTKLTGGGESGHGRFGRSVALSADGSTALIGGPADHLGAAWVFARSGSSWSQQGTKLTGSGIVGGGHFGRSVALSASGDTALIGAPSDSSGVGASWVFTRSGSTWTQQGSKLTGTEESGDARFGFSVALSADGGTALVGGRADDEDAGAAWVFTRAGNSWTQQADKLTGHNESGDNESGAGKFGYSVALSADGNIALIGGLGDSGHLGAAWAFTRTGTAWSQQDAKLLAPSEIGNGRLGASVALSGDGASGLVGAPGDNGNVGAAWAFLGGSAAPPTVTSIAPSSGPSSGGTKVTINGSGFLPGATVQIGSPASSVDVVSETQITAETSATAAGEHEVLVTDSNGTSSGGPSYTYLPSPAGPGGGNEVNGAGPTVGPSPLIASSGVLASIAAALPPPTLALIGNLAPVSGSVLVRLPGSSTFVPLTSIRQVPFGTVVDARHGKVSVTTARRNGGTQTMTFFAGEFILTQRRDGVVLAALFGGDFSVCPARPVRRNRARATSSRASRKHAVRKLWAEGHGTYSTKGNYATGAVLGTRWLTEDLCAGTLIRVATDRVAVTNLLTHRRVTVKAGHSYLAKAP